MLVLSHKRIMPQGALANATTSLARGGCKSFVAIHTGRKQAKTVDEIADETRQGRQQVLNAATKLAHRGLCHREKHGNAVAYRKDPFYQGAAANHWRSGQVQGLAR